MFLRVFQRLAYPPRLTTEDATARARIFHGVAWIITSVSSLLLLILAVREPQTLRRRVISVGIVLAVSLLTLQLNRWGKTRLASWLFVGGVLALISQRAWTSGGLSTTAVLLFLVITMIAGLLLDTIGALIVALTCALIGLLLVIATGAGALPSTELTYSPLAVWLYSVMSLGIAPLVLRQITVALRDSLRRAQAEASARAQTERRLRLAMEAGGFAEWDQDVVTRAFRADPTLFALYGIERPTDTAVDYETWTERVHPEDLSVSEGALRAICLGATATQAEFRIVRTDGTVRHIESAAAAVFDEHSVLKQIVGVSRDVTERKAAEHQRAMLLHDLGERVKELRLLHAAARMLQLTRPSDEPLFQELVDLIPPAFQFPECCEACISLGPIRVTTANWHQTPWLLTTAFRTGEGQGSIEVAYLKERPHAHEGPFLAEERTLLESLAEMIAGHAELRRHHDHLEELVSRKTQQLRVAVAAADRANQAKSTFLATMSHEIRTPMNAMLGYAQLLRRDDTLTSAQREKVETILASGDHLLVLINNVLEMSKIEAGRAALTLEAFDLPALLESVHQMFRELAHAKGLALVFSPFEHLPRTVEGDAGKIRQVLINLLSNALKFTRYGEVTVAARATEQPDGRHRIEVDVADNGPGISAEDCGRLFTAFEQSRLGARVGGTGLGLSISRELARVMDGDLTVASEPGVGSTFSFSFLARATTQKVVLLDRPSGRAIGLDLRGPAPRVLVVDDQAENRALLSELLTTLGFETQLAKSGEEALALHDRWRPNLILMDLRMPGMGGVEAIRRLRAQGSNVTIVGLTASGLEGESAGALGAGAEEVLWKPYREAHLLERIRALLGLRYVYREPASSSPVRPSVASDQPAGALAELLWGVPEELLKPLHDAVLEARPARIQGLAAQVATHSPAAAELIASLVRDFSYEALDKALSEARRADARPL